MFALGFTGCSASIYLSQDGIHVGVGTDSRTRDMFITNENILNIFYEDGVSISTNDGIKLIYTGETLLVYRLTDDHGVTCHGNNWNVY